MFLIIDSITSMVSDLMRISFIKLEAFLFFARNFINKVASPLLYIFGLRDSRETKAKAREDENKERFVVLLISRGYFCSSKTLIVLYYIQQLCRLLT